jgi:hypothetical protein
MKATKPVGLVAGALALALGLASSPARAADHNDPNGANSIFSDIAPSPADLYDLYGFPVEDASGERVVVALTFGAVPRAGTLDPDLLYRVFLSPGVRVESGLKDDDGLEGMLKYFDALKDKYAHLKPSEVRVNVDGQGKARVQFFKLPGGDFSATIEVNQPATLQAPGGFAIKAFVGGRDDAFFNDLPGFFRSINYAPQFYHVPLAMKEARELKIPKTLIELEGNTLFNFNPAIPLHGQGVKLDLPPGPLAWNGNKYHKDAKGNYRFVYSGKDAQAGRNVNAIILEIPLGALTRSPADRIVNAWGESWVLKAATKVETIPDDRPRVKQPLWLEHPWAIPCIVILIGLFVVLRSWGSSRVTRLLARIAGILLIVGAGIAGIVLTEIGKQRPDLSLKPGDMDAELQRYKLVDTDGQPFADAALNQREDSKQLGAYNFSLAPSFVTRLAHLGWGFGPSISALGLKTSFELADLGAQGVRHRAGGDAGGVPAREEGDLPAPQHARRQVEAERDRHPAQAADRDLHSQRLPDRHGHHRHLAVRAAAGGSGRVALPVAVPGHVGRGRRSEGQHRDAEPAVAVGQSGHRAQDAAQPAEERQGVPRSLPLPG